MSSSLGNNYFFLLGTFDFVQTYKSKVTVKILELDEFSGCFWDFNLH